MKFTKEQIEEKITHLIKEGKTEDAILTIVYELTTAGKEKIGASAILNRLNQFIKIPFTLEDLDISMKILQEKKFVD